MKEKARDLLEEMHRKGYLPLRDYEEFSIGMDVLGTGTGAVIIQKPDGLVYALTIGNRSRLELIPLRSVENALALIIRSWSGHGQSMAILFMGRYLCRILQEVSAKETPSEEDEKILAEIEKFLDDPEGYTLERIRRVFGDEGVFYYLQGHIPVLTGVEMTGRTGGQP